MKLIYGCCVLFYSYTHSFRLILLWCVLFNLGHSFILCVCVCVCVLALSFCILGIASLDFIQWNFSIAILKYNTLLVWMLRIDFFHIVPSQSARLSWRLLKRSTNTRDDDDDENDKVDNVRERQNTQQFIFCELHAVVTLTFAHPPFQPLSRKSLPHSVVNSGWLCFECFDGI